MKGLGASAESDKTQNESPKFGKVRTPSNKVQQREIKLRR
jgi:hypothetical protein